MQDEHSIELLLKKAGKRESPDADISREIEQAARLAWQEAVVKHKKARMHRLYGVAGIAAAFVLVIASTLFVNTRQVKPPIPLANIANRSGVILLNNTPLLVDSSQIAKTLKTGDTIETRAESSLALTLSNGITLLSGADTRFRLDSANQIFLHTGKLYFDSHKTSASLVIQTHKGSVTDIGTQYEVLLKKDLLRISMREGEVIVDLPQGKYSAFAGDGEGDVLEIYENNTVTHSTVSTTDSYWHWVLKASQYIDLEGQSVYDVLEQMARLTGRAVVYKDANAQRIAIQTRLSGGKVAPEDIESTIPMILKTTNLSADLQQDRIEINSTVPIK